MRILEFATISVNRVSRKWLAWCSNDLRNRLSLAAGWTAIAKACWASRCPVERSAVAVQLGKFDGPELVRSHGPAKPKRDAPTHLFELRGRFSGMRLAMTTSSRLSAASFG